MSTFSPPAREFPFDWNDPAPSPALSVSLFKYRGTGQRGLAQIGTGRDIIWQPPTLSIPMNHGLQAKGTCEEDLLHIRHRFYGSEDISDLLLLAGEERTDALLMCPVQLESWQGVLVFPLWRRALDASLIKARHWCTDSTSNHCWWSLRTRVEHSQHWYANKPRAQKPLRWWLERLSFQEPDHWRIVL